MVADLVTSQRLRTAVRRSPSVDGCGLDQSYPPGAIADSKCLLLQLRRCQPILPINLVAIKVDALVARPAADGRPVLDRGDIRNGVVGEGLGIVLHGLRVSWQGPRLAHRVVPGDGRVGHLTDVLPPAGRDEPVDGVVAVIGNRRYELV